MFLIQRRLPESGLFAVRESKDLGQCMKTHSIRTSQGHASGHSSPAREDYQLRTGTMGLPRVCAHSAAGETATLHIEGTVVDVVSLDGQLLNACSSKGAK